MGGQRLSKSVVISKLVFVFIKEKNWLAKADVWEKPVKRLNLLALVGNSLACTIIYSQFCPVFFLARFNYSPSSMDIMLSH